MTRHRHPVAGIELLGAPEMQLRHPAERAETARENQYDEGEGCGFDNESPDAYVERWVEVDEGASNVLAWFVEQFAKLGWTADDLPKSGTASVAFHRDDDEHLSVLLQGFGQWWLKPERDVKWDQGVNHMRVSMSVNGVFPDGSLGAYSPDPARRRNGPPTAS